MSLWSQQPLIDPYQTGSTVGALFPEFNGWHGGGQLGGFTQQEWNGFEGRPQNYHMFGDLYIPKAKSSLGGIVYTEIFGQTQSRVAAFNYTYRIHIGDVYLLPSLGYARHQFVNHSYWGIPGQHISETYTGNQLNGGLGFIYDKWYGAIHYSGYSNIDPNWIAATVANQPWSTSFSIPADYSAICGRSIAINEWTFYKSIVARSNLSSIRLDFNFNASYKRWMGGVRYILTDGLVLGVGYDFLDRYRLSYSNVIGLSRIRRGSNGTHELAFRILLNSKTDHRILKNISLF
jgi:hypothetical protein